MTAYDTPIAKLGHVAAYTPGLEESLWFFEDVSGSSAPSATATPSTSAVRDWEHHTLALTEADRRGVDHQWMRPGLGRHPVRGLGVAKRLVAASER